MSRIKDVAKVAGVSTATVSRVLANHSRVKEQTRRKVMEAVEQLNYRPNLVARSLRVQKSAKIGLVVSDIRNPFFTAISRAVEDYVPDRTPGFRILICVDLYAQHGNLWNACTTRTARSVFYHPDPDLCLH